MDKLFLQSVFAGLLIGLGGFAYLSNTVIGTFLFAFGLACVVLYKLPLFTGTAGFIDYKSVHDYLLLALVLLGNILGALLSSTIALMQADNVVPVATEIIVQRSYNGIIRCFLLALGCGVVMSAAVEAARSGNSFVKWLPLVLGVPLFIQCGMVHSIADSFYFFVADLELSDYTAYIPCWISAVFGNALGCNAYRILQAEKIEVN